MKNFRMLWILFVLPMSAGIFFGGCKRQVANPTFPPTYTFTVGPTNTWTNSSTPTPLITSTFTATRAVTSTATTTSSPTVTATATVSSTPTSTTTATLSPTVTDTFTITSTPTDTDTTIPGATATSTPTVTSSPTQTQTATPTGTFTSTASPTVTSTVTSANPCTKFMCSFESLTENGSVSSAASTVTVAITPTHVTLGTNALKITVATGGSCNLISWTSFAPSTWTNVTQVVMDVYIDPSLISGNTNQLGLFESSAASGWWTQITDYTDVVAGSQSVTLNVDWAKGVFTSTSVLSNLVLAFNNPGGTGSGSIYIDNVRLVGSVGACPPSPPSTCGLMDSFETATENGNVSSAASTVTVARGTSHATVGTYALQIGIATGGSCNLISWTGFAPSKWPDVTVMIMDMYIEPSLISGNTNQLGLFESSAASGWWTQITDYTDVVAGSQSVTLTVDWAKGSFTSASVLSNLVLAFNNPGGTGTGSIYIDNVRLSNGVACNP